MSARPLLAALTRGGYLRPLDRALAQTLHRRRPDTPDAVLAAAALASLAVAQGHAGLPLTQPEWIVDAPLPWPAHWSGALGASPWVDQPGDVAAIADPHAPLVLENGLLYLRRHREYERRLALALRRIAAVEDAENIGESAATSVTLAALLARMFPGLPPDLEAAAAADRQAQAAVMALRHHLLLITGGPGTGKTTTIARILLLLAAQAGHRQSAPPRVALAAPTGRAAERMAQSLRMAVSAAAAGGLDPALSAALPASGMTLHRLLGVIPDSPYFRHDAAHRLPYDVVVVDEVSMLDLPLMTKLAEAVPDGGRLLLLGDPDQLPPVEAGDVLGGLVAAAQRPDPTPDDAWHRTCPAPVRIGHVHLRRGYRQVETLELAPLAAAVRDGDVDLALDLLRAGRLAGVQWHATAHDPLVSDAPALLAHWTSLAAAQSPAQALAQVGRLGLLTALRDGPGGARGLNARIETMLRNAAAGSWQVDPRGHFHGRLLLITRNSAEHGLFNGDIGICLRGDDGALTAWFPGDTPDTPRPFHPAILPPHESAFAMTVHKAQGSEFETVWLWLPAHDNRALSRELAYTGITRARASLHLVADAQTLRRALARPVRRASGLAWRLAGVADRSPRANPSSGPS